MSRKITIGIDVGTNHTRVVVAEYLKGENVPTVIGTGFSESRGLRHGYVINFDEAVKSIRAAVEEAQANSKIKIKRAFISMGGMSLESSISHGSAVISKADSEVTELDVVKALNDSEKNLTHISNKRIIDKIPVRWKIDGKEIHGRPTGMKGMKLEVKTLFVMCLEQHLNDLVNAVEEAGVEVLDVIASPVAAGYVTLNRKQRTVGCMLVNIGAETVSMAVFENDSPISLHVFPIGSTDITNDIALGLKVSLEEAEEIKLGAGSHTFSKKKLDDIIEARLTDIFELIESHLKKIGRNGLLPAGILITGGGSGIATIEDLAKLSLKLPVKVTGREISDRTNGAIKDSTWFVAYGLTFFREDHPSVEELDYFRGLVKKIKNNASSLLNNLMP